MKNHYTHIRRFNQAVFRRAKLLGGTVEYGIQDELIVQVPEHAIDEFKRWMEKECVR